MKSGKLIFLGLGIKSINHITIEGKAWMENCDLIIHHAVDPLTESWISDLNKNNFSLNELYKEGVARMTTYSNMVDTILRPVREGQIVCVALYGNPGFYVYATHKAAKLARSEGYYVEINPGVSSLDTLLTDLDIDIVNHGLQVLEASSVLLKGKKIDTSNYVVIMQPGPIGEFYYNGANINEKHLHAFKDLLVAEYGGTHEIIIYSAAIYSIVKPQIIKCQLDNLDKYFDIYLATFCIPPKGYQL